MPFYRYYRILRIHAGRKRTIRGLRLRRRAFTGWPRNGLADRYGPAEVGRAVGLPGELLRARPSPVAATVVRSGVGMIENPVFRSIRRFEKAVVPGAECACRGRLPEHGLRRFPPRRRIEQVASLRCGQHPELVI